MKSKQEVFLGESVHAYSYLDIIMYDNIQMNLIDILHLSTSVF